MLGRFLPSYPRDSFVIATKVGRYDKDPKKMFDFSAEKTLASGAFLFLFLKFSLLWLIMTLFLVDESLKKLGLDFVDIIQVHDVEFAPNLGRDIFLGRVKNADENFSFFVDFIR